MKNQATRIMIALFLLTFVFVSCKKSDNVIEDNGLTKDINDVVSQKILNVLDSLGMPINKGGNPPTVTGTFLSSPHVLYASNRSGDEIGKIYDDLQLTFSNQNQKDLTITTGYSQSNLVFEGMGSFIVGDQKMFSVFVFDKEYATGKSDSCLIARIFSGEQTSDGISGFYTAIIMLDDYGDPHDKYIEIGDARVLYDQDGLAENYDNTKSAVLTKGSADSGN
jgi:hypothetical protein